jgi:ribonuclease HII
VYFVLFSTMLRPRHQDEVPEAGCDEAGRGCLAGPVFAAAVILPPDFHHPLLDDSKRMTATDRETMRAVIQTSALAFAVAAVEPDEIDRINILQASLLAMHRALDNLTLRPGLILVDGNRFLAYPWTPHLTIVQGDATYASIAAASVLAKTERDRYMLTAHERFPDYAWDRNKGYPTREHRTAIRQHGLTPLHRRSFRWDRDQPT